MTILEKQIVIIGAGPAGMSAAAAAYDAGCRDILVLERDGKKGGILQQCIHNGFGLHRFGVELTGPEYAARYEEMTEKDGITFMLDTMVTKIDDDRTVTAMNPQYGNFQVKAGAVILAMGCRERPKGALNIAGTRPAGIYTAGTAQKFVNKMGYMPGKRVVILGSGDIGLIMARRMTLEGAKVEMVCELMPYSGGLSRNIEQCLNDFDIPLYLSTTVVEICGKDRLEGVYIAKVDEKRRPIEETRRFVPCDTLLLSCGLLPENELTLLTSAKMDPVTGGAAVDEDRMTSVPGVFACGNVLHVHDLVDYVSEESAIAGKAAFDFVNGKKTDDLRISVKTAGLARYTVPQLISGKKDVTVYFRVSDNLKNAKIVVYDGERVVSKKNKLRVAPGEMETVLLSSDMIGRNESGTFTVSVEVNQ